MKQLHVEKMTLLNCFRPRMVNLIILHELLRYLKQLIMNLISWLDGFIEPRTQ